jgi:hypothetical protein
MSGNNFAVNCPKCGAANNLRGKAMTRALTCQQCKIYFRIGNWNAATVEFMYEEPQALPLGARGKVDGFVYEVIGFVIKQEYKYHFRWREYLVFNPFRGYAFLSEYNGHWNFVWPIEENPRLHKSDDTISHDGAFYNIYQKYSAKVVHARGEFFFDVFDITASTTNTEYIAPPYILALEKSDDSVLWCKGEYFHPKEIADAFSVPVSSLPSKEGIGYTQPFESSFSKKSLIQFTVLIILFALVLQLFVNNMASDKVVYSGVFRQEDLVDQKMFVTPSFELTGGTKSLEVLISASLSNDWFFSEFTLVNETDGTEYNFAKEIEYYYGTEDGEAWTEGSRNGEAFLSQIPEGRYHLNIYPEFSFNNHAFDVTVKRDVPMMVNFFITCLALLAFPIFYFVRDRNREQRRWSESDYTPYE